MLTEFCSPGRAPKVSYVDIFRDHADPHRFYLIPDRPRIANDEKTGTPLFDFTLFSRNIDIAYASAPAGQPVESQLGALNFTVDMSIEETDMAEIRLYLSDLLKAEMKVPSQYNTLFKVWTTRAEPMVGYVEKWTAGTVTLQMLEGLGPTFKRASSPAGHPTLVGSNSASLWATFGTEGAQLLYKSLKPDENASQSSGPSDFPLQAMIQYDITTYSRTPALRVSVTANADTVYREARSRTQVYERANGQYWTYPQVSALTKDLVDNRSIEIRWDDYGIPDSDPKAEDIKNQLQQTVLGMITNQLVALLFKPFEIQGIKDEDLGTTFTHSLGGKPGSRLWLNDYQEGSHTNIGFSLDQTQNVPFQVYPQTSLLATLTPDQIEKAVRVVDVGSPEVRVLTVTLLTNADFVNDKIANITVSVSYRQFDTLVNDWIEASDSFVFKTGQETFTFRTRLARDQQGRLIDVYDAKAQINYIGTTQSPPPIDIKGTSDRTLTFSYDRLGYVKVDVQAGDVDWTQIKDVYVDFVYPSAQAESDAKASVHLTQQALTGKWTCSKHGSLSNAYRYSIRYIFTDGREVQGLKDQNDSRGSLVIHDELVGKLRRTFDVVVDPQTVESVFLKVRYQDGTNPPEEVRNVFNSTGSWEYTRSLSANASQNLTYTYSVSYKDGQFEVFDSKTVGPNDDVPTFQAKRYKFSLGVDGGGIDWNAWRTVLVRVVYNDDDHKFTQINDLRLTKDQPITSVDVLAFAVTNRSYSYRATFVPLPAANRQPVNVPAGDDQLQKSTGTLLLEMLVP